MLVRSLRTASRSSPTRSVQPGVKFWTKTSLAATSASSARAVVGILHVEGHASLTPVDPDEAARRPAATVSQAAGHVAAAWALDLDDVGAEVGEESCQSGPASPVSQARTRIPSSGATREP